MEIKIEPQGRKGSYPMTKTREALTVDQLMNLSVEDADRLKKFNLPNSDDDTDDEQWAKNAENGLDGFMKAQEKIINLFLGRHN